MGSGNRPNWGAGFTRDAQGKQNGGRQHASAFGTQNSRAPWGSGYQGGSNQNTNRFAALSGSDQGQRQQRFGQQNQQQPSNFGNRPSNQQAGSQPARQQNWRELVERDSTVDAPIWPLSCYCHQLTVPGQGGVRRNDFDGDFSFEELRWAQMQAAKQGATSQTLSQEFNAAQHARQQAFAALRRAQQPPSLGGPPQPDLASYLPAQHSLLAFRHSPMPQATPAAFGAPPATPFGQVVGAFGRNPSIAAQPSAFGAAPPQQANPFNRNAGQAFGAGVGQQAAANPTGSFSAPIAQPTNAFGRPPTSQQSFQPGLPSNVNANAQAFHGNTAFQQPQLPATGQAQASAGQQQMNVSEEDQVWLAQAFDKGKIPDKAPPSIYCK